MRFVDCRSGVAVAGVEFVELVGRSGFGNKRRNPVSDSNGVVIFPSVQALTAHSPMGRVDRRVLLVRAHGYAPKLIEEREDQPADWGDVCLDRGSALEVRVLDPHGRPSGGTTLRVHARTSDLPGAPRDLVGLGTYRIGVGRHEFPAHQVDPITGRRTYLGLEGKQTWEGLTDASGSCLLEGLPTGVSLSAEVIRERTIVLTVDEGLELEPAEHRRVRWVLPPVGRIDVYVRDQHDNPISGHVVAAVACPFPQSEEGAAHRFLDPTESSATRARTDRVGRATLDALPNGSYLVGLVREKPATPCDPNQACSRAARVEVQDSLQAIELALAGHRGLFIQGGVHDSNGRPLSDATLVVLASGGSGRWIGSSRRDGRFCVGPVEPGAYTVTCRDSSGSASTTVNVSDDAPEEAVLVVERGSVFRIELLVAEDRPHERFIAGSVSTNAGAWPGQLTGEYPRTMEFSPTRSGTLVAFAETSERRVVFALADPGELATTLRVESEPAAECLLVTEPDTPDMVVVFGSGGMAFHQVLAVAGQQTHVRLPALTLDVHAYRLGQPLAEASVRFSSSRVTRLLVPSLVEER